MKNALVLALLLPVAAIADPSTVCDDDALRQTFIDMSNLDRQVYEAGRVCAEQEFQNCQPYPDAAPIAEGKTRLKLCADAGSAAGAGMYGGWIVEHEIAQLRRNIAVPASDSYESLPAKSRERIDRVVTQAASDAKAKLPGVAAEALSYLQKSYTLDSSQGASAEYAADLLASGDVGPNRRYEALDWYFKASSSYTKLISQGFPKDVARRQQTRILDKMAQIDRENPLTKKVEQEVYK